MARFGKEEAGTYFNSFDNKYLLQYFEEGKLPARDFFGVKFLTELSVVAEVLAAACEHVPLKF